MWERHFNTTLQRGYCEVQIVNKHKEAEEHSRNTEQKTNVWVWSSEAVFLRGRKSLALIAGRKYAYHPPQLPALKKTILLDVKGEILTGVMSNSLT